MVEQSVGQDASADESLHIDRAALRAVWLSSLGGAVEFFDFIVYGTFAAYISKAFFPADDALTSQLGAFAGLAVGYLARPIGGLVFGQRGDMRGRRSAFVLSLAGMSAATIGMGLVPSYASIGPAATIIFVLLRLIQGFCLGGELAGSVTYAVEVVPPGRTTLACGVVFGCVSSGVLLATGMSAVLHAFLTPDQMQLWGWRVAFMTGGIVGTISWFIRKSLEESPAFVRLKQHLEAQTASPLSDMFLHHWPRVLVGIATVGILGTFNGLMFAHMAAYLIRTLGYPPSQVATAITSSIAVGTTTLVVIAWIGDYISRLTLFRAGCLVLVVGAYPAYSAMATHSVPLLPLFIAIGLAGGMVQSLFAAVTADLFPTRIRFSGIAISLNIGTALTSGLTPLLATEAIKASGINEAPAVLLMIAAGLSLLASLWVPKLGGQIKAGSRKAL
jgi:MFS family permease